MPFGIFTQQQRRSSSACSEAGRQLSLEFVVQGLGRRVLRLGFREKGLRLGGFGLRHQRSSLGEFRLG